MGQDPGLHLLKKEEETPRKERKKASVKNGSLVLKEKGRERTKVPNLLEGRGGTQRKERGRTSGTYKPIGAETRRGASWKVHHWLHHGENYRDCDILTLKKGTVKRNLAIIIRRK